MRNRDTQRGSETARDIEKPRGDRDTQRGSEIVRDTERPGERQRHMQRDSKRYKET